MDHEISHGRDSTWTLRAVAAGFRVAVEAPKHITEAWAGTSWIVKVTASGTRDSKPFHATHLFLTSLRTAALNLLRLVGFRSIRAGLQAVMQKITALLAMARRQPQSTPC